MKIPIIFKIDREFGLSIYFAFFTPWFNICRFVYNPYKLLIVFFGYKIYGYTKS